MLTYGDWWYTLAQSIAVPAPGNDATLASVYYDGLRVFHYIYAYTGNSHWLLPMAYARNFYLYYVNSAGGRITGFRNFTKGLRYDWERMGDLTSKTALATIVGNAAYSAAGNDGIYISGWAGSRENAYSLNGFMDLLAVGDASRSSDITRYLGYALGHLDQWVAGTVPYYLQPFMTGLTMRSLIQYYEEVDADSRIPTKIKAMLDVLWSIAWEGPCVVGTELAVYARETVWANSSATAAIFTLPESTQGIPATVISIDPGAGIPGMVQILYSGGQTGWFVPQRNGMPLAMFYDVTRPYGIRVPDTTTDPINQEGWNKQCAPDLSLLICPAFAWYYKYSLDTTYRDRGDLLFAGGVAGADLTANGGKTFNQSYIYSFEYVTWREAADVLLDAGGAGGGSTTGSAAFAGASGRMGWGVLTQTP